MGDLTNTPISDFYKDLLQVPNANNGIDGTLRQVQDGAGNGLPLWASTSQLRLPDADINGGTIDGTVIGGTSPAAGTFTTFTSNGIDDNASATALTIDSSGNIQVGSDTDVYADIGRARVGFATGNLDFAGFAHIDQATPANYAFMQQSSGDTFVNAPSASLLRFRKGNADVAYFDTDGFLNVGTHTALGGESLSGYITFKDLAGNARKVGVIS